MTAQGLEQHETIGWESPEQSHRSETAQRIEAAKRASMLAVEAQEVPRPHPSRLPAGQGSSGRLALDCRTCAC